MTVEQFIAKLKQAQRGKSLYVSGCFGAPMNATNKARYRANNAYNSKAARQKMIDAASNDTFGFDCVCLIKGILWGWNGDTSKRYGGAVYKANNVPDVGADTMCSKYLTEVSTDFSKIVKGAAVWLSGHIGIYIGDGQVIECTPKWTNNVQLSWLGNIPEFKKGNYRVWTKWGKLPWIDYSAIMSTTTDNKSAELLSLIDDVVKGVSEQYTKEDLTKLSHYAEWKKQIEERLSELSALSSASSTKETEVVDNVVKKETVEEICWKYLLENLTPNKIGVASLMGNLEAESAFIPNNVQNSYEKKVGKDAEYTAKVDNGTYSREEFTRDAAGYGLAQWTYWSRKQGLYDKAKAMGVSIADLNMQLIYLVYEIKANKTVFSALSNATSIREASDVVLKKFERPADQSDANCASRAARGERIYAKYTA